LQERSEEITGSCRKSPEIAGCGSSIPTGNLLDFFPVNSSQFPAGILLPEWSWISQDPTGSCRTCLTWDDIDHQVMKHRDTDPDDLNKNKKIS
jgi:hypothetical protein